MKYPGACSLEYQNVKKIIIETLLQWDDKKEEAKGVGIVGTTKAFVPADEEQGRGTLHSHWQIWVEELNQKVRDILFDADPDKRARARKAFCTHIDEIMCATYGADFTVTHVCTQGDNENVKTDLAGNIFQEREPKIIRNARHNKLSSEIGGNVMECPHCNKQVSTIDIVNSALARWKEYAIQGTTESRPDITLPISKHRLDMAAYTYSYNMDGGCYPLNEDPFWSNENIRRLLLTLRFDEHAFSHKRSCFKKVSVCYKLYYVTCLNYSFTLFGISFMF